VRASTHGKRAYFKRYSTRNWGHQCTTRSFPKSFLNREKKRAPGNRQPYYSSEHARHWHLPRVYSQGRTEESRQFLETAINAISLLTRSGLFGTVGRGLDIPSSPDEDIKSKNNHQSTKTNLANKKTTTKMKTGTTTTTASLLFLAMTGVSCHEGSRLRGAAAHRRAAVVAAVSDGQRDGLVVQRRKLALPPGYEDEMWCPPGSCNLYVNPYEMVGPSSSFFKCYQKDTTSVSEAVWTGSLTDVVAPEGWITAPELTDCPSGFDGDGSADSESGSVSDSEDDAERRLVLPPGYEDVMWCPPGNCDLVVNRPGFAGPASQFNKCYDPETGTVTNGVWTGALTFVIVPEGYVQSPEECSFSVTVDTSSEDEEESEDAPSDDAGRRLALPPGYEDEMWCPPGSCDLYTPHGPGFAGPQSAFHKCFDEQTDKITDGVWTGSLTDVVPPEGYITSPELQPCSDILVDTPPISEYSSSTSSISYDSADSSSSDSEDESSSDSSSSSSDSEE